MPMAAMPMDLYKLQPLRIPVAADGPPALSDLIFGDIWAPPNLYAKAPAYVPMPSWSRAQSKAQASAFTEQVAQTPPLLRKEAPPYVEVHEFIGGFPTCSMLLPPGLSPDGEHAEAHPLALLKEEVSAEEPIKDGRQPLVTSIGSARHATGDCQPCLFWFRKSCAKGVQCDYCHIKHNGQKNKRIRPSKKTRMQLRAGAGAGGSSRGSPEGSTTVDLEDVDDDEAGVEHL